MLRREVVKMAGGLFGLGKPQPSRFPYAGRPQPSPGVSPAPGLVTRANKVIVFGPVGTVTGIFVYAVGTTPALGNPPIDWISQASKDPFGNVLPVVGGVVAHGTGADTSFVQMAPGTPAAFGVGTGDAAETRPGRIIGVIQGSGATRQVVTQLEAAKLSGEAALVNAGVQILSPSVDLTTNPVSVAIFAQDAVPNVASLNVTPTLISVAARFTATSGTAAKPNVVSTDLSTAITSFSNGWTVGTGIARCMLMPIGFASGPGTKSMVYLELVLTPGTLTDGTTMCALPSSTYFPASTHDLGVMTKGGTAMTNAPFVQILSTGNIQCESLPTGTTSLRVSGFYPLD